ncbi:MAG: Gfo/Idh/MocA family oxidoreductase [Saprospiraceae bacterium]|nr:Gfo/Idh/MocA family oxidoreductase [Saprospiraceae bacterium]
MFSWGILGLGRIAHKFAAELLETKLGVISAVGSRDLEKAKTFGAQYQVQDCYGSYEDLIAHGRVDAIYLATPHPLHAAYTLKCLQAGIPVLCEKPFTINARELKPLIETARANKVFLMEAMWSRFMPHLIFLKELHDTQQFGKLLHLKADFSFKGKERAVNLGVRRLVENNLGGGSLLDIGVYPVFLAQLLLGKPLDIIASASIQNEIDETCQIICTYPDAVSAYLSSSILWESDSDAELFYENGTVKIPKRWHENGEIHIWKGQDAPEIKKWNYPSRGFYYEIKEAQECILSGKTESELMPLDFSMGVMETLDRIRSLIGLKYAADVTP